MTDCDGIISRGLEKHGDTTKAECVLGKKLSVESEPKCYFLTQSPSVSFVRQECSLSKWCSLHYNHTFTVKGSILNVQELDLWGRVRG